MTHEARFNYAGARLDRVYTRTRQTWGELYPSERWIFERVFSASGMPGHVLDVGCAAGGVGRALVERFGIRVYTGLDINRDVVTAARTLPFPEGVHAEFVAADIVDWHDERRFDTVISLAAADWNVDTEAILAAAWDRVRPGGTFIVSLRLTELAGVSNLSVSYQMIDGESGAASSRAAYVVFNVREAFVMLRRIAPDASSWLGYGYRGQPSATAVTPFTSLVFAVFAIVRSIDNDPTPASAELHLPVDLLAPQP